MLIYISNRHYNSADVQQLNATVADLAAQAYQAIDAVDTAEDIERIRPTVIDKLANYVPNLVKAKEAAEKEIADKLNSVKEVIDNNNDITERDKTRLREEAERTARTYSLYKKIMPEDVAQIKADGLQALTDLETKVRELGVAKKEAKEAIQDKLTVVKQAIRDKNLDEPKDHSIYQQCDWHCL